MRMDLNRLVAGAILASAADAVVATGESHYGEGDLLSVPGLRQDGRRISLEFTIVPLRDRCRVLPPSCET
jgi:hypothetical protein